MNNFILHAIQKCKIKVNFYQEYGLISYLGYQY